jgi:glycosyltransferase involved in cell wall biosynthesis
VHLTALVESPDHVCCRYRLAAFRPWLEQAGHRLELRPFPRSWWSRLRLGHDLRHADAVILQRKLLPVWQLGLLRRSVRYLLFDFDDAVFLRDSYAAKGMHSSRNQRRFTAVARAADIIIAGNTFLAEEAARWAGTERVRVIPTCVDPGRYPCAQHPHSRNGLELVWVGSSSTLRGLEAAQPLLEEIGRRLPGLRLKLICNRFFQLQHLPVIECRWTEAGESAAIAAADVGISWVPDDLWSLGKCGLKVLQYMAAGLPVVANPVGVQRDLVQDGVTGFLAATPGQWVAALSQLAHDPGLRRRMGSAGRKRVEKDYGVSVGATGWLAVLRRLQHRQEAA